MSSELEKLHQTLIEILDYVFSVCEENNLTCLLLYGTALGAYRHKGFIPWDDDVDVGMPRDDYEKFINIMKTKKDDIYLLQDEDSEDNYFLSFAKVRKKNTVFIESIAEKIYENNGIYIDIFPLDFVSNKDSLKYKIRQAKINYYKHILKFHACKALYKEKYGTVRFFLDSILSCPAYFIDNKKILDSLNNLARKSGVRENAKYIAQYDQVTELQVSPYEMYFPVVQTEFGNKKYNVPGKIEEYLRVNYGETYMELPPEDKRTTHKPLELKF